MEKKVDRRIVKSQKAIQNAFLEILLKDGLDAVTVKDITEKADVSRKTFYLHYTDKYALLDAIVDQQLEELGEICEKKKEQGFVEGTVTWFRYFEERRGFFAALFAAEGTVAFRRRLLDFIMGQLNRKLEKAPSKRNTEVLRKFIGKMCIRDSYKTPILDRDGKTVLGTVGIGHDVTDLVNMSAEMEILLESMPYAILLWNNGGQIINANAKFEEYFHTDRQSVIGRDYNDWMAHAFEEKHSINNEGYVEAKVCSENGAGKVLEIHESSIYDVFHNVAGKLCIFRDVTLERDLERQIRHSSNTDFLTGLYNRRCFYQYIHNNRGDKTVSLMYIDLDRFKAVNDTCGHKVGDAVLMRTARILMEFFRDDFVARLGGDEFLMVRLGYCGIPQLEQEADCLIQKLREALQEKEGSHSLSASIGIAQSSDPELDIDLLLQQSDQALYQAKKEGRACYRVYRKR